MSDPSWRAAMSDPSWTDPAEEQTFSAVPPALRADLRVLNQGNRRTYDVKDELKRLGCRFASGFWHAPTLEIWKECNKIVAAGPVRAPVPAGGAVSDLRAFGTMTLVRELKRRGDLSRVIDNEELLAEAERRGFRLMVEPVETLADLLGPAAPEASDFDAAIDKLEERFGRDDSPW
jgi:hypothetical protein